MYPGMEVISTDLPRKYGRIKGITSTTITVHWGGGRYSRYKLGRATALPFQPVAVHLTLVPRETIKRDSRDMHPQLIKNEEYDAWDDGKTLVINIGSGFLHLERAEREGVLKLCEKVDELDEAMEKYPGMSVQASFEF